MSLEKFFEELNATYDIERFQNLESLMKEKGGIFSRKQFRDSFFAYLLYKIYDVQNQVKMISDRIVLDWKKINQQVNTDIDDVVNKWQLSIDETNQKTQKNIEDAHDQ